MYVSIFKYIEYNIEQNRHEISIQKGLEYKPTFFRFNLNLSFLSIEKLRFKHFKIHTKPSKRLRLTPLRTNFTQIKRGTAQNTRMRRRFPWC